MSPPPVLTEQEKYERNLLWQRRYREKHRLAIRERNRQRRAQNVEQALQRERAAAARNREAHREACRHYRRKHAASLSMHAKVWRQANRDAINAQERQRYAARREQLRPQARARSQRYAKKHPERIRAALRAWYRKNPDKVAERHARRAALKMQAPRNDLTAAQWKEIKAAYDHRCVYCGKKQERLTQDHITPLVRGGANTVSNVVPACKSCNSRKKDRAPLVPVQPLLLTIAPARAS